MAFITSMFQCTMPSTQLLQDARVDGLLQKAGEPRKLDQGQKKLEKAWAHAQAICPSNTCACFSAHAVCIWKAL